MLIAGVGILLAVHVKSLCDVVVVVDNQNGENNPGCGALSHPCKTIFTGVKKAELMREKSVVCVREATYPRECMGGINITTSMTIQAYGENLTGVIVECGGGPGPHKWYCREWIFRE